jgi:hypothetical protein
MMQALLTPGTSMEPTLADIEAGVGALENSPKLKQSLASILKSAEGEVDSFLSALEVWFDRQMDRVTGSYKRWAKRWVIAIAVVVVCAGNIDSVAIARAPVRQRRRSGRRGAAGGRSELLQHTRR